MKFILGTKVGMTRIFDETGNAVPVTLIQAGPVIVTALRTRERDGYEAVQVGFGKQKAERLSRAVRGHLKGLENFRWLREFRIKEKGNTQNLEHGSAVDASVFQVGDVVKVSGVSKGKGFAGVVKRHGFKGGPRTHGQKHSEREPGSIATGRIQTIRKGKRMAGRMGGCRVTVSRLKVAGIDRENNMIWVSGAIPGNRGTLVEIRG
jgi:large subunit ribosomal protein L3